MDAPLSSQTPGRGTSVKVFGLGKSGISVTNCLIASGLPEAAVVALDMDEQVLALARASEKIQLETQLLRGLGSGGDPERAQTIAEEKEDQFRSLCGEVDVVLIVVGLGGGTGTGIAPVLARSAKESGALVLSFATLPFDCEGSRRQRLAQAGLESLKEVADGVICLPSQRVAGLIDENAGLVEIFKLTNEMLAGGVRGIWRLLMHKGLIEIHVSELCSLLRDRHLESAFAFAEGMGATRSREVLDKLLTHPLLDNGRVLEESHAVLVSLMGGPDLTMTEVSRVMNEITARSSDAQIIMGAALDETFRDRLVVTIVASRKTAERADRPPSMSSQGDCLDRQLLGASTARPGSRFIPPAPALPPEKMAQMLARQGTGGPRSRRSLPKLRQGQLPLEIVSKGRFDKSEPTIHKGEDLDVPTYIRRGVALN